MAERLRILVAEDLPDNVELLKLAFTKTGVPAPVHYVADGEEAILYLKGEGGFGNRAQYPLPTMLLLDLKMPRLDGFGVLEWLRLQSGLRRLPVVVFTSSDDEKDIQRALELGANCYIVKPAGFDELQETVRSFENLWLRFNRRPNGAPERGTGAIGRRVLLRDAHGRYSQGGGRWTDSVEQAMDLEHRERAVQWALGMRLKHIEIAAEVEDEHLKINVRVNAD